MYSCERREYKLRNYLTTCSVWRSTWKNVIITTQGIHFYSELGSLGSRAAPVLLAHPRLTLTPAGLLQESSCWRNVLLLKRWIQTAKSVFSISNCCPKMSNAFGEILFSKELHVLTGARDLLECMYFYSSDQEIALPQRSEVCQGPCPPCRWLWLQSYILASSLKAGVKQAVCSSLT